MGGEGDSGVGSEPDFEQLYVAAGDDVQCRPWPVSRAELDGFIAAGLSELTFREDRPTPGRARTVTAVYERRAQVPA